MARAESDLQPGSATATEIPSKHLPAVPYRDLPEPKPLRRIVGPSIILLGGALGSGEYILWPYITSQVGLILMWAAVLGIITQYFLNMEIERYTLATGETAVTGFTRLWKHWSWLFVLMTLIPWVFPGWATGAATALTFALGGGNATYIAIAMLVGLGLCLTVTPIVYQFVEKIQSFLVVGVLLYVIAALILATEPSSWLDLFKGFASFGELTDDPDITPAVLLGALAFAGAGGTLNLTQSNWIREKRMAMGTHVPRIASPFTGEEVAAPSTGAFFRQDEQNLARWRGWWKVANREQFWVFLVAGGLALICLSVLADSTVNVRGPAEAGEDFAFIRAEGQALQAEVAPWFGTLFWIAGAAILLTTNLAILEMVGRVSADVIKINWLRESEFWTESKLYFVFVWAEIIFGSAILLAGVTQPVTLIVISSALNGFVMFVYGALFLKLNGNVLPRAIRLKGFRMAAIIWSVLFFGYFSAFTVIDAVPFF